MFGKDVSKWTPSDIDFCVTKKADYDFVKKHFKDQGYYVYDTYTNTTSPYSDSMADVTRVCNIYQNVRSSVEFLQVILAQPIDGGGLVSHLKHVDLDVTRVAYTTRGFIGVGNALESIAAGESSFPSKFRNIRCLNKTFRRSVKYSRRGVTINYPKYITYVPQSILRISSICSSVRDLYTRHSIGKLVLKSSRSEESDSAKVMKLTEQVEFQKRKIDELEAAADDSDDSDEDDYDDLVEKVGGYKAKMAMILSIVNSDAADEVEKFKKKLETTEKTLASLKSDHEKTLASLKSDHEKDLVWLRTLQKDLESHQTAKLSDVSAKLTVAVDDLAQLQKKAMSQKKLLNVEMEHSNVLQQENRDLTTKVKDLEEKLQIEIDNVVKLQLDYHEASEKLTASTTKFETLRSSILEHVSDE